MYLPASQPVAHQGYLQPPAVVPTAAPQQVSDQDEVLRQWQYRGAGFINGYGDEPSLTLPLDTRPRFEATSSSSSSKRKKIEYASAYTVQPRFYYHTTYRLNIILNKFYVPVLLILPQLVPLLSVDLCRQRSSMPL